MHKDVKKQINDYLDDAKFLPLMRGKDILETKS